MSSLGIDLGTFNSSASSVLGRKGIIMVNSKYTTSQYEKNYPSFVLFDKLGNKDKVGKGAKDLFGIADEDLIVWGIKRIVGMAYKEALDEGTLKNFDYDHYSGSDHSVRIRVRNRDYSITDILKIIIQEIKEDYENPLINNMLGAPLKTVVVSVPAYFKSYRTELITSAVEEAFGSRVDPRDKNKKIDPIVKSINEPTAAAIAFGIKIDKDATIFAFDLGAGTLDVTILQLVRAEDGQLISGELTSFGYEALGGIDMDLKLTEYLVDKYNIQIKDKRNQMLLRRAVEQAKIRLSTEEETEVSLPPMGNKIPLSRNELESVLRDILEKCRPPIKDAFNRANISPKDIDHVLFIGGPTHMPCIRKLVKEELEKLGVKSQVLKELNKIETEGFLIDPMECVSRGAALYAGGEIPEGPRLIPEGYGVPLGPVKNNKDFYYKIIPHDTFLPISGEVYVKYGQPCLIVNVPIVAKRRNSIKSTSLDEVFDYFHVGNFPFGFTPVDNSPPVVKIEIKIDQNKKMSTILTYTMNPNQQTQFNNIQDYVGDAMDLQEHTEPAGDDTTTVTTYKTVWTQEMVERLVHSAQEVLSLVKDRSQVETWQVEQAINDIINTKFMNLGMDGPNLYNEINRLLFVLKIKRQISEIEFLTYRTKIDSIILG
jgi:molecular chaperone DnaK (HSP70)